MPGSIKLCSPGTFWVANYLIINNSSCQVNFTKLNTVTIRYTNSQWLREDATEAPVEGVALPKTGQENASPREDASEPPVAAGAVPNPVVNPTIIPSTVPISFPSPRDPAPEVLQLRVPVPKGG